MYGKGLGPGGSGGRSWEQVHLVSKKVKVKMMKKMKMVIVMRIGDWVLTSC